ncbi:MAG: acyl-CoA dehydrogenase family protein [Saprospiraceae bacterium]|nr:acyl-CoA dehydrogenase family protein [Saprospiraceae bacterium]
MAVSTETENILNGGEFIIRSSKTTDTFCPEDFTEEQNMIQETVEDFNASEVFPNIEKIEKQENNIAASLLEKFGDLGLLGTHMPETYGGMDMDFNTNTIIGEAVGPSGSFSVAYNAHTGIGMLPILYFGTQEQKDKYLPKLVTGEFKASYCLTEPSSGSDALSAKTSAVLSEDGSEYVLNGQKMWITNAGFADIFTIFAQVDGDKFTGFIVERETEGLTFGAEEKKLGIKGSSTRMVFMENVRIPASNLLGEIGKGHHIAFNVLNTGRFKLGASVLGGSKKVLEQSIIYANERVQFKQPISSFGAIQHKIAEMGIQNFLSESALYRTSHLINEKIKSLKENGETYSDAKLKAAEEYALECSIIKILGSEVLDYCVDEGVQIHGGMGYSEEGHIARAYRDSRINRIFEGTNEINRMVIINTILKKAMKGQLDIVTPALAVQSELQNQTTDTSLFKEPFELEKQAVHNFKKVLLMILGSAAKLAMEGKLDLKKEQELLMNMADIVIHIFSAESALLRILKIEQSGNHRIDIEVYSKLIKTVFYETSHKIYKSALDAIAGFIAEEQQEGYIQGFRKFTKYPLQNVKSNRRAIAELMIEAGEYCY